VLARHFQNEKSAQAQKETNFRLTSSSERKKQTLTQLKAPSTGKGGGTSFGSRWRRGEMNKGLVF
jgi:hypothetical protein